MKSKSPRAGVMLSPSTEQRLTSYALAASAAGVGVLALTMPAEGRIIYTRAHHVITHGGSFNLDLNHDGVTDFTLRGRYFTRSMSTFISMLSAFPATGNGVDGWTAVERSLSGTPMPLPSRPEPKSVVPSILWDSVLLPSPSVPVAAITTAVG